MDEQERMREKLAFFGKIIASLSHEIMNVIATEKELSGLLEDLVFMARKKNVPVDPDRLQAIGEKLSHQALRGETLVRRLNKFSHSVDEPVRSEDLRTLVTDMVDICGRFASLQQVELNTELSSEGFVASVDPFAFYQALFVAIHSVIRSAEKGDQIQVAFEGAPSSCQIRILRRDAGGVPVSQPTSSSSLTTFVEELGGEIKLDGDHLVLTFY